MLKLVLSFVFCGVIGLHDAVRCFAVMWHRGSLLRFAVVAADKVAVMFVRGRRFLCSVLLIVLAFA